MAMCATTPQVLIVFDIQILTVPGNSRCTQEYVLQVGNWTARDFLCTTHNFVHCLAEDLVLAQEQEDDKEHVEVVRAVLTGPGQLLEEREDQCIHVRAGKDEGGHVLVAMEKKVQ